MSTAEERFQAMMAKRKKTKESVEKEEKPIIVNEKNSKKDIKEIFVIEDSVFGDFTNDVELIEYLKNKSLEMLKIQGNNIIMLGKNLTEVFEELGRKGSPDGLYLKYLEFNKEQDSVLPELEKNSENLTYKKMLDMLKKSNEAIEVKEKNSIEISSYNIDRLDSLYRRINNRYDELDEKRKEKLDKLLFEIEKLLG